MEPERKIEKLLRAYSRKRLGDAGGDAFKLHPATRRMLQAEVARQAGKAEEEPESLSLWDLFRERWAVLLGFALLIFFCASLFLPALSKAKSRSSYAETASKLKQIGVVAQMAAADNHRQLPATLDELANQLGSPQVLTDSVSGKPFVYVGGGASLDQLQSSNVLAYSPEEKNRAVLFADGSVRRVRREEFARLTNGTSPLLAVTESRAMQPPPQAPAPAPPPPPAVAAPAAVPVPGSTQVATVVAANNPAPSVLPAGRSKAGPEFGADGGTLAAGTRSNIESDKLALLQNRAAFKSEPAAANASAGANNLANNYLANNSQRYRQILNAKLPSVLNTFEVQQNGNQLAIVDQDGSVYNGSMDPVPVAQEELPQVKGGTIKGGASQLKKGFESASNQLLGQNYFFRVSGANRSLKQNVVFTGNIIAEVAGSAPAANATQKAMAQNTLNKDAARQNAAQNFSNELAPQSKLAGDNGIGQQNNQSPFSNARITGTVTIDRTNRIEINALPMTP